MKTIAERFWPKVDRSPGFGPRGDCWCWTASTKPPGGYGQMTVDGRPRSAHVVSIELDSGEAVPRGAVVCHTCDTPLCVNPAHLYVGTHATNSRDRCARGGQVRGARVGTAKLTADAVLAIRRATASGRSDAAVAREHGVSASNVQAIRLRRSWAHLPA